MLWPGVVAHRDGVKGGPGISPGLMADDSSASVSIAGLDEGSESPGTLALALEEDEEACCSPLRLKKTGDNGGGDKAVHIIPR